MTSNRIRLVVALLLAVAVLPGWAFAGEPASTTTYKVGGTTIQWNHAGAAAGADLDPKIVNDLRALVNARLRGEAAPITTQAAPEKLANGMQRVRVPAEKYSIILFQIDPTKGLLGPDGAIQLDRANRTCNEAGHIAAPSQLISSEASLY